MENTKLAFISDIHSNVEALKSVLEDIQSHNIPLANVYCLGDIVGYGPSPNETIELIQSRRIKTILGNYDEAVGFYLPKCGCTLHSNKDKMKSQNSLSWTSENTSENNKKFLRSLDENYSFDFQNKTILLTHGSPYSISDYVYIDDTEKMEDICTEISEDIIVFGHTHFPYFKKINGKLFINAGSVGRPKDSDNRACYCIVDFSNSSIEVDFIRVQYDIAAVVSKIRESSLLDVFGEILIEGKDL